MCNELGAATGAPAVAGAASTATGSGVSRGQCDFGGAQGAWLVIVWPLVWLVGRVS